MSLARAQFAGKVALVTGAGRGVGRQVALALAENGARAVVVNDCEATRAEEVAAEVHALGARAMAAPADVGDVDAVERMFAAAADLIGPVSILVNNAGIRSAPAESHVHANFLAQNPAEWDFVVRVNFGGVIHCTRSALAQMIPAEHGRIVTVISDAARVGEANGLEVYSGAKAGAAGFTRAVARMAGRFGITANCVALGATMTPATEAELNDDSFSAKLLSKYIVRRFGEPADAAAAILFLSSESAGWITGQTLPVNGGYSLTL